MALSLSESFLALLLCVVETLLKVLIDPPQDGILPFLISLVLSVDQHVFLFFFFFFLFGQLLSSAIVLYLSEMTTESLFISFSRALMTFPRGF